jgi:methionine aminotransferase
MSRLAAEHGAINLSQGFPDFSPPPRLPELVGAYMAGGHNQYAPMPGAPSLRAAIADKLYACYGVAYDREQEITVTAGATQAIHTAISALVRPGDEVIVFSPVYDSYVPAVEMNGGRAVYARLRHPDYRPDWAEFRGLLSPRTRLVIVNTPHNPTGSVWETGDFAELAAALRETDACVLSDEVYEHVVFDDRRHASVTQNAELRARSFVVSSFGKTYHITGWKLGYCAAPAALTTEFRKAHQFVVFAVNHPMQLAIADYMRAAPEFAAGLGAFYQEKRDRFRAALAGSRFELLPCAGTYFQLAGYRAISDEPDTEFVRRLTIEHGVAAIPISVFSPDGEDHRVIRFCFAKGEATLAAAAERLRSV